MSNKIQIKNMVCSRCVMVVRDEFLKSGIEPINVELGFVELKEVLDNENKNLIQEKLIGLGFEIIEDKKIRTVERIKNILVDLVHHNTIQLKENLSEYLSEKLLQDYSLLSSLFSEIEGITVEKYFILQKIERVKELIIYNELNLSEIADSMHYSSVAHLSTQFKNVTGMTPSGYKKLEGRKRIEIEKI